MKISFFCTKKNELYKKQKYKNKPVDTFATKVKISTTTITAGNILIFFWSSDNEDRYNSSIKILTVFYD